jgi:hypothetical protein
MKRLSILILTAALAAVSFCAQAQSEDALKHAATMEAIGKMADAMKAQADAMAHMADRVAAAPVQMQVQSAPIRDCSGWAFLGCAIRETWAGAKDVLHEVQPFAGPVFAYKTAIKQYDYQAIQAKENTIQEQSRQGTLQYAFGAQRDTAKYGFDAIGSQPPGTVINNSGTGNNFGSGQLTYAPISDAYKVGRYCYPTSSTVGGVTTTGQTCVGG